MLRIGRNFLVAASLGLAAGCNPTAPSDLPVNNVADVDLNDTVEVSDNFSDITASAPVDISFSERYGSYFITIKNSGSEPITIQKLVVNAQENDSDCNIKVFRQLAVGASTDIEVPRCGAITTVQVITDQGERTAVWDTVSQNMRISAYNVEGYRRITINNIGGEAWTVNKIVINQQASENDCNIKVFRSVAPNSSIDVSADRCGQINEVDVNTNAGTYSFTIRNEPVQETGNTTGM